MRRFTSAVAIAAISTLMYAPVGAQTPEFEVDTSFDVAAAELPEGLSIDSQGATYVTLGPPFFVPQSGPGWVKRISADGDVHTLAEFDDGAPAGIVVDAEGEVYFARPNPGNEESRGIYHLSADGTPELLAGTEDLLVANGLALDGLDGLFASDSALGTIWRIPLDGGSAEPWFSDQALTGGCGEGDVGANGVALWQDGLYVANTSRGLLVRIAIEADGSAGATQIVAGDDTNECQPDALFGMDGIAFDSEGSVYAALVLQNQLVRIDPSDGSFEVLLTAEDGLHNPASLAFGTTEGDRSTLYITNYAVLDPVPPDSPGPAVLSFDAGVEGATLS